MWKGFGIYTNRHGMKFKGMWGQVDGSDENVLLAGEIRLSDYGNLGSLSQKINLEEERYLDQLDMVTKIEDF